MTKKEITDIAKSFGHAVCLARDAGFDAVEVHAGHGYLISQFLSPYTNRRSDEYGGSTQNRMRFLNHVVEEVMTAAAGQTAVLLKMNMRDGFAGGVEPEESLEIAKCLEQAGVHALVLSSGFVSRAPMQVMRGAMPISILARHVGNIAMQGLVRLFGKMLVPPVPFAENYFLDDARLFRRELKMPLVYVGGVLSRSNIEAVLSEGFDAVAIARALIREPDFIKRIEEHSEHHSSCDTCNYCIAVMYNGPVRCIQNIEARA